MIEKPLVGIIMGSDSDLPMMEEAFKVLEEFQIHYEVRILSAHRAPRATAEYARNAERRGLRILIAGAGWAAHLAGVIAAETILPVIGVPLDSSPLQGIDSLLSTVQMPPGIPVASMAIGKGGAKNAALFAVQVLALQDPDLCGRLREFKRQMADDVTVNKKEILEHFLAVRTNG